MNGDEQTAEVRSLWGEGWRRLRRNRLAIACMGVIGVYFVLGALEFVPVAWTAGSGEQAVARQGSLIDYAFAVIVGETDKEESYASPGTNRHILGTDIQGRDVLLKTIKGMNTALVLGGLTAAIYIPLGLLFGIVAGYFGGRIDDMIVYIYSTLACIPGILLLIALMTVMERGLVQVCIALGVTGWVGLCRLIRGETLKLREADYVLAARAIGARHSRVLLRHVLPNLFHIVIITFTLGFSGIVLSEALLTYLGVGVEVERTSWGRMISHAKMELTREPVVWWQFVSAAVALFLLVLAFNVLGDALRDALDPRLRSVEGGQA